jgi:hypothetical protein
LKAFADHGDLAETMSADDGDCETVLAQFAATGIDVYDLAARLQAKVPNLSSTRGTSSWVS